MKTSLIASIVIFGGLSACSGGSSGTSNSGSAATAPVSTIFGLAPDTRIDVASHSASRNETTGEVRDYTNVFWLKSRDDNPSGDVRHIHYGKPHQNYQPRHNYPIPISITDTNGQLVGTGTATFTGDDVESGVTSRTITLTDVELTQSVFGVFSTKDSGTRGDFLEIHAYAAGIDATGLPANATYSGTFVGDVISESGTGAVRVDLPANLTVDFTGGSVAGTMGSDISIAGTVSGTSMSGTASVTSSAITLANGSSGTFNGGFFGAGGLEAAGTIGISDTSGALGHELVGAFGATQN